MSFVKVGGNPPHFMLAEGKFVSPHKLMRGYDINGKYKSTSGGGSALNVFVKVLECWVEGFAESLRVLAAQLKLLNLKIMVPR